MEFCWELLSSWHPDCLQCNKDIERSLSDTGVIDLMGRRSICSFNCISSRLWMQCGSFWASSCWCPTVNVLFPLGSHCLFRPHPFWLSSLASSPCQTLSQAIFMELPWHCTAFKEYSVFSTARVTALLSRYYSLVIWFLFLSISPVWTVWYLFLFAGQFLWPIFLDGLLGSALFLPLVLP